MDKREEAIRGKRREESRAGQGRGNIYLKTPPRTHPLTLPTIDGLKTLFKSWNYMN